MKYLKFFNGKQYLFDLIRLRHAFLVLNVYTGITRPRRFINTMATSALARRSKVVLTDFLEITEPNPFRIRLHILKDLRDTTHRAIVALLILNARTFTRNAHTKGVQRFCRFRQNRALCLPPVQAKCPELRSA